MMRITSKWHNFLGFQSENFEKCANLSNVQMCKVMSLIDLWACNFHIKNSINEILKTKLWPLKRPFSNLYYKLT